MPMTKNTNETRLAFGQNSIRVGLLALAALLFGCPAQAQEARKWNFRATNYEVSATLIPAA